MNTFELIVKGRTLVIDLDKRKVYYADTKRKQRDMSQEDFEYFKSIASFHIKDIKEEQC